MKTDPSDEREIEDLLLWSSL